MLNPMRQRLLKTLRIAVTAVSLLVCALLIVLWVRSYFCFDDLYLHFHRFPDYSVEFTSWEGTISTDVFPEIFSEGNVIEHQHYAESPRPEFIRPWFYLGSDDFYILVVFVPHWFLVTIFAAFAAVPWIKWRFSLRTLLIVLTLFAVFFGMIAMSL